MNGREELAEFAEPYNPDPAFLALWQNYLAQKSPDLSVTEDIPDLGEMLMQSSELNLFPQELLEQPPAAVIAMPIDSNEDPDTALHALRVLQEKAKQERTELGGPLEVVPWVNYLAIEPLWNQFLTKKKKTRDVLVRPEGSINILYDDELWNRILNTRNAAAQTNFTKLVHAIDGEGFDYNHLRIRPVLDHRWPDENMNIVRTRQVEAISYEAMLRKLSMKLPVIFLDVDLTYIENLALPSILDSVRSGKTPFTKALAPYTEDPGESSSLFDRGHSEQVTAVFATVREMLDAELFRNAERPVYIDEHGLGFTIETWLRIGGINTANQDVGEARAMLWNAEITGQYDKLVTYLPDARVGTSWRQLRNQLDERMYPPDLVLAGTIGLRGAGVEAYNGYSERIVRRYLETLTNRSQMEKVQRSKIELRAEINTMLGGLLLLYGVASDRKPENLLTDQQRQQIGSMLFHLGLVEVDEPIPVKY